MVFEWKQGRGFPVSAQIVGERLAKIEQAMGKEFAPRDLVEDARPKTSPTHALFEWDNRKAGDLYREQQAKSVIIALVRAKEPTESEDEPQLPRQVYVGYGNRHEGSRYCSTLHAMNNAEIWSSVLTETRRQIKGLQRRLEDFQESAAIVAALDQAISAIDQAKQPA
jgi:hypothetical protein